MPCAAANRMHDKIEALPMHVSHNSKGQPVDLLQLHTSHIGKCTQVTITEDDT